jgi:ABC-type proline/glycine betaine transport system permease subunit
MEGHYMGKFKIILCGIGAGLIISLGYSLYIYKSDPMWGDLTAIASFIVLFPSIVLLALLIQLGYIIYR